jgi:hypothetical protein
MKLRKATLVVKALIVTGAVAATTMGLAAPAWAGQNVSTVVPFGDGHYDPGWGSYDSGYGAFHHKGDWLQLVDRCSDRYYIDNLIVYLQVRNGAETRTYYVAKKGQRHRCGERWINRDFREGRDIAIRVCIVRRGRDRCAGWRWGIA